MQVKLPGCLFKPEALRASTAVYLTVLWKNSGCRAGFFLLALISESQQLCQKWSCVVLRLLRWTAMPWVFVSEMSTVAKVPNGSQSRFPKRRCLINTGSSLLPFTNVTVGGCEGGWKCWVPSPKESAPTRTWDKIHSLSSGVHTSQTPKICLSSPRCFRAQSFHS